MKRIAAFLLAAWMLLSLMGCGSESSKKEEQVIQPAEEQVPEEALPPTEEELRANIIGLSFHDDSPVELEGGQVYSDYFYVRVMDKEIYDASVIELYSEDSSVAEIRMTAVTPDYLIYYEITGVSGAGGETRVLARTADGRVLCEGKHVKVKNSIVIESLELIGPEDGINVGDTFIPEIHAYPDGAAVPSLTWESSYPEVASVDENGRVIGLSAGGTIITATAPNGIKAAYVVKVSDNKTTMTLSVKRRRRDHNEIGENWSYSVLLNNNLVPKQIKLYPGMELKFFAEFTENDKTPDVGSASVEHVVTEEDIMNGFSVELDLYVTENVGKNEGQTAHFTITFTFKPSKD